MFNKGNCSSLESEVVFADKRHFIRCKNCHQELVHRTSWDGVGEVPICANGHYIAQDNCTFCQRKLQRQQART